jgi:hypothetical protein
MHRFAVILTHNRPDLLRQTWEAIGPQVDMVIILDNASDPPVDAASLHQWGWKTAVIQVPEQPPNISRLWNKGIDAAMSLAEVDPFVAMLCDDAPPPPGWFEAVTDAMTQTGAVIGCSAPQPFGWAGPPRVKTAPDSDLAGRMPGWAWILDPVSPVRADESMAWWWCDTDIDWQARAAGGMVMIGSHPVPNVRPNDFTGRPDLMAQSGQDGLTFVTKHGFRPW